MEIGGGCVVFATVIGLTVWLAPMLNLGTNWPVIAGVLLGFPLTYVILRWVLPRPAGTAAPAERQPGFLKTDHTVTIAEGPQGRYLVALCDAEDCGWMEFAHPGLMASQEKELRALVAKHTSVQAPGVKWREAR